MAGGFLPVVSFVEARKDRAAVRAEIHTCRNARVSGHRLT